MKSLQLNAILEAKFPFWQPALEKCPLLVMLCLLEYMREIDYPERSAYPISKIYQVTPPPLQS